MWDATAPNRQSYNATWDVQASNCVSHTTTFDASASCRLSQVTSSNTTARTACSCQDCQHQCPVCATLFRDRFAWGNVFAAGVMAVASPALQEVMSDLRGVMSDLPLPCVALCRFYVGLCRWHLSAETRLCRSNPKNRADSTLNAAQSTRIVYSTFSVWHRVRPYPV